MGFFTNTGTTGKTKELIAEEVLTYMRDHQKNIGFYSARDINPKIFNPWISGSGAKYCEDLISRKITSNVYFNVNDDLSVSFKLGLIIYKLDNIWFKLAEDNSVALKMCKDGVFDSLPKKISGQLILINSHRNDGTISFKNLEEIGMLRIQDDNTIKSMKGLEDTKVACFNIKNCKKLETMEGCPTVTYININSETSVGISNPVIDIAGCPVLKDIYIPNQSSKVTIFINDKNCPSVERIIELPKEVGFFGCKGLSKDSIKDLNTTFDNVEFNDYKGRGSNLKFIETSADAKDVKKQIKKLIDDLHTKHWKVFPDLHALITYYNLNKYAEKIFGFEFEKSRYVEDGMIHSYDPVGELAGNRYYSYITRDNIKRGVCNYLNQFGVKYHIINNDPKKKKENEFIVIDK